MKAKDVSIWVKILAVLILVSGLILKGCGVFSGVSTWDIIAIAFSCELVFLGVSASIIIDKFIGKRE